MYKMGVNGFKVKQLFVPGSQPSNFFYFYLTQLFEDLHPGFSAPSNIIISRILIMKTGRK